MSRSLSLVHQKTLHVSRVMPLRPERTAAFSPGDDLTASRRLRPHRFTPGSSLFTPESPTEVQFSPVDQPAQNPHESKRVQGTTFRLFICRAARRVPAISGPDITISVGRRAKGSVGCRYLLPPAGSTPLWQRAPPSPHGRGLDCAERCKQRRRQCGVPGGVSDDGRKDSWMRMHGMHVISYRHTHKHCGPNHEQKIFIRFTCI